MEVSTDINVDDDLFDQLSSSPSIHEEEIDFQYVYALRAFIATEQGQANAEKGDAMILLNDANSYWWLVRMVKDSTVGFLPAEHVETPWERLARLNKHRNGEVCSNNNNNNNNSNSNSSSTSRGFGKMFKSKKSKNNEKNNAVVINNANTTTSTKSVSFNTQSVYVSASEYEDDEEADDEDNGDFSDDEDTNNNNNNDDTNDRDDNKKQQTEEENNSDDNDDNEESELSYTNLAAPRPLVVHKVRQTNSKENLNGGFFSKKSKKGSNKHQIPGDDLGASILAGEEPDGPAASKGSKGLIKAKSSVENINSSDGGVKKPKAQANISETNTISPVSSPQNGTNASSFNIFKRKKSRETLADQPQPFSSNMTTPLPPSNEEQTASQQEEESTLPLNIHQSPPKIPAASNRNVSNQSVSSIQSESGFQVQQPHYPHQSPQSSPQPSHLPPLRYKQQQRSSPTKRQSVPVFNNNNDNNNQLPTPSVDNNIKRKSEIHAGDYYPQLQSGMTKFEKPTSPLGGRTSPQRYAGRNGGRVSPNKQNNNKPSSDSKHYSLIESNNEHYAVAGEIHTTEDDSINDSSRDLEELISDNKEHNSSSSHTVSEEEEAESVRNSISSQPLLNNNEQEVEDENKFGEDSVTLTDDEIIITETNYIKPQEKQQSSNTTARNSISPPYLDERGDEESPVSEQEDTPVLLASMPEHNNQWNESTSSLSLSRQQSPAYKNYYENGKNKGLLELESGPRSSSPDKMIRQPLETKVVRTQQKPLETTILSDLHPDIVPIFKETTDRLGQLSMVSCLQAIIILFFTY